MYKTLVGFFSNIKCHKLQIIVFHYVVSYVKKSVRMVYIGILVVKYLEIYIFKCTITSLFHFK